MELIKQNAIEIILILKIGKGNRNGLTFFAYKELLFDL